MKTFVDGLYKLTDYQFYLFSIDCKLQIAIFTVFTVKTKNFGHLYSKEKITESKSDCQGNPLIQHPQHELYLAVSQLPVVGYEHYIFW